MDEFKNFCETNQELINVFQNDKLNDEAEDTNNKKLEDVSNVSNLLFETIGYDDELGDIIFDLSNPDDSIINDLAPQTYNYLLNKYKAYLNDLEKIAKVKNQMKEIIENNLNLQSIQKNELIKEIDILRNNDISINSFEYYYQDGDEFCMRRAREDLSSLKKALTLKINAINSIRVLHNKKPYLFLKNSYLFFKKLHFITKKHDSIKEKPGHSKKEPDLVQKQLEKLRIDAEKEFKNKINLRSSKLECPYYEYGYSNLEDQNLQITTEEFLTKFFTFINSYEKHKTIYCFDKIYYLPCSLNHILTCIEKKHKFKYPFALRLIHGALSNFLENEAENNLLQKESIIKKLIKIISPSENDRKKINNMEYIIEILVFSVLNRHAYTWSKDKCITNYKYNLHKGHILDNNPDSFFNQTSEINLFIKEISKEINNFEIDFAINYKNSILTQHYDKDEEEYDEIDCNKHRSIISNTITYVNHKGQIETPIKFKNVEYIDAKQLLSNLKNKIKSNIMYICIIDRYYANLENDPHLALIFFENVRYKKFNSTKYHKNFMHKLYYNKDILYNPKSLFYYGRDDSYIKNVMFYNYEKINDELFWHIGYDFSYVFATKDIIKKAAMRIFSVQENYNTYSKHDIKLIENSQSYREMNIIENNLFIDFNRIFLQNSKEDLERFKNSIQDHIFSNKNLKILISAYIKEYYPKYVPNMIVQLIKNFCL